MVTKEQFKSGLIKYIENEIVAKADGLKKWGILLAVTDMLGNVDNVLKKLPKNGYVQVDGMMDIDKLYTDMHKIAESTGPVTQHFPVIGDITFNTSDIESIYRYILS